jgi:hypothetical protein
MLLDKSKNRFRLLVNIPKELKVIRAYVQIYKDSLFDRILLEILLVSKYYFPLRISQFNEKVYKKLYQILF